MKALVCPEYGELENLVLEDRATPEPGDGEVRIATKAAGINFPDILQVEGKYQFKPPLPFIPGSEVSGVIAAVGVGVTSLAVGDKVFAKASGGAFAEECIAREQSVFRIGETMSFEQAAGLTTTYGTSYYALKQRANLQPGETVLVLGAAGGVGIATIQLAKVMGATVIAAASSDEKLILPAGRAPTCASTTRPKTSRKKPSN